jgi:hypothetical protein
MAPLFAAVKGFVVMGRFWVAVGPSVVMTALRLWALRVNGWTSKTVVAAREKV